MKSVLPADQAIASPRLHLSMSIFPTICDMTFYHFHPLSTTKILKA